MFARLLLRLRYVPIRAMRNATIALFIAVLPANAKPHTLLALGDSLTAGYGLAADEGLVPQLQNWLTAQGEDVTIVNAGVSGDTTAGGAARLDWSLTPEIDAMIVTLGGNDLLRGINPATSRANLEKILAAAATRNLPVLLIGLTAPANYGPAFKAEFDAIYPDLAAKYQTLLVPSFFAPLQTESGTLAKYMQLDGIHPNAAGVVKIVAAIGPQTRALLQSLPN
jgi:acyl-CoA thioesterase I